MSSIFTKLTLGDFTFDGYEIPESIPFGGSQVLVMHRHPGGARTVQSMGRDDAPIGWSGLLYGEAAYARATYLDSLRVAGKALELKYHAFNYTVVIDRFEATLRTAMRIPYSISLTVVSDNTSPTTVIADNGFDAAIRGDMDSASTLGGLIGDGPLSGLLTTLDTAIRAVSDFAKATTAQTASVVGPLGAVIGRVNILIGSAGSVVNNVTTLGGVLPNNPISTQAAQAVSQVLAVTQMPLLVNLLNTANRLKGNLGISSTSQQTQTQTVAGGTLFDVAAKVYGDASKWVTIAKANGLTDPVLSGVTTLKIPNTAPDSGGIVST